MRALEAKHRTDYCSGLTALSFDILPWQPFIALSFRTASDDDPKWRYYPAEDTWTGFALIGCDNAEKAFEPAMEYVDEVFAHAEDHQEANHLFYMAAAESLLDPAVAGLLQKCNVPAAVIQDQIPYREFGNLEYVVVDHDRVFNGNYCEFICAMRVTRRLLGREPGRTPGKTRRPVPKSSSRSKERSPSGTTRAPSGPSREPDEAEHDLIQKMQEHPDDDALRMRFTDSLIEREDPRGELLRLLHTLTQAIEVPQREKLEERLRELLAAGVPAVGPFYTNSIGMKFAWIPPGVFLMGSPENEKGRDATEEVQHKVTLTEGFYMAIHPVTQASWENVMGNNPSRFQGQELERLKPFLIAAKQGHLCVSQGDALPVEGVSWEDCQQFLEKLGNLDGHSYRLPTEAEWEYACRAGTTTRYSFGQSISRKQANFKSYITSVAGSYPPNGWGLFDMHGNVGEWCADWFDRDYPTGEVIDPQGPASGIKSSGGRVIRGGSLVNEALYLRSACRAYNAPTHRYSGIGFRPVRSAP